MRSDGPPIEVGATLQDCVSARASVGVWFSRIQVAANFSVPKTPKAKTTLSVVVLVAAIAAPVMALVNQGGDGDEEKGT